ncbi:MAG: hypothetical protein ACLFNI_00830 [Natronomonas sp.]
MSVSGLCEICEAKPVVEACNLCGRLVCADHYDRESGLCTDCLAEFGRRGDDDGSEPPVDPPDGVDEYRF